MLHAFPPCLHQRTIDTPLCVPTIPMQHMGILGCVALLKKWQQPIARRQGHTTSSSCIWEQTLRRQRTSLAGGVWVSYFYYLMWCSFGAESLNTVPSSHMNGAGLPCHSRLSDAFRMCILEHKSHWLKASQLAGSWHIRGTPNTEECVS